MSASNPVPRLYRTVVDEVVKNVRESFLNEGVDEQVLLELKQLWESKLLQSRAIDFMPADASVRVNMNLTYPLTLPQSSEQSRGQKVAVAGQIVPSDNGTGPMVYVSHHPTLANVQQLSAPAAQAALAMQGTSRDNGASSSATSTVQQIQNSLPQQSQQSKQQQQQQQQQHVFQHQLQLQQLQQIRQHQLQQQQQHAQQQQQQQQKILTQHVVAQQQQHGKQLQRIELAQGSQPQQQQNTGIQVLQGEPSTTVFGISPGGRGPRVIYTQPVPQHQTPQQQRILASKQIIQVDGADDSSSDEDDDNYDDFDQYPIKVESRNENDSEAMDGEEDEALNTDDDISEEDPVDLFDTDNVVVCQYDKIARSKNKWKFYLKDGIMNLKSKDYVFHKANGESEW